MHGKSEVATSRYFALYLAQACWIALGAYLLAHAYWPSTCRPDTFLEIYGCSGRLGEQHHQAQANGGAKSTIHRSVPPFASGDASNRPLARCIAEPHEQEIDP